MKYMAPPVPENLRQIEILARLLNGERLNLLDLELEYDVSRVTLNRDLAFLRLQGFSVYSRKLRVLLTETPGPAKLTEILAEYLVFRLNRKLVIENLRAVEAANFPNFFQIATLCAKAVDEKKILKFRYARINDGVENDYTVRPVELKQNDFNWILYAVKEGEVIQKEFYLSRMKTVSVLETGFEELEKQTTEHKYLIEVRFPESHRNSIYSKIRFPEFKLEDRPEGFITLTTEAPINRTLATWCLKWEDKIQVIDPPELKTKIKEMVDAFFRANKF